MMAKTGTAKTAYIHWLGVALQAQGQGIATMLLTLAEEKASRAGQQELSLHTESSNKTARGVYRRFGMHETFNLHLTPQVHFVKKVEATVEMAGVGHNKQSGSN
jgi:GNAT superfamily N-acetyltransferase